MMMRTEIGDPPLPVTVYFYVKDEVEGEDPDIRVTSVIVNFEDLVAGLAELSDCLNEECFNEIGADCRKFLEDREP